jgi:HAD superfamily hydrolase (TIGR01549 family)
MKQYDYLLFDWDGCLGMTLDVCLDAYRRVFAEYDLFPEDSTITQEIFGDWSGPKKLGITNVDTFMDKWLVILNERYPYVNLYNGVKETLEEIKKRDKKMALVTTSKLTMVKPALEKTKLMEVFDVILSAEDVTKHKPDPEIIEKAITRLGGNKESAIIIGDSKSDLGAAQNAGIDSILFYPEHNQNFYDLKFLETYQPTYTVKDFEEILDVIV